MIADRALLFSVFALVCVVDRSDILAPLFYALPASTVALTIASAPFPEAFLAILSLADTCESSAQVSRSVSLLLGLSPGGNGFITFSGKWLG